MAWRPFGRSDPADEGLSRDEVMALESERLFPSTTIRGRGRTARREGSEARAHGFTSSGRKVHYDAVREESLKNRFPDGER
jgi:hypothetical protein